MRRPVHGMMLLLAAGALVLAAGCPKKTQTFDPAAGDQPAGETVGTAGGGVEALPGPQGSDFGEKPVDDLGEAAGGIGELDDLDLKKIEAGLLTVYFEYNSPELSAETLRTLEANAAWLLKHPHAQVEIQGHCDERGSTMYNLDLGAQRARAVREHLLRLGLPGERLETKSYGEELPAVEGSNEQAWSRNRRAEFKVIGRAANR